MFDLRVLRLKLETIANVRVRYNFAADKRHRALLDPGVTVSASHTTSTFLLKPRRRIHLHSVVPEAKVLGLFFARVNRGSTVTSDGPTGVS